MPIRFKCPCGKILVTADRQAGKHTKCPACGKPVAVPAQPAPDGEALRLDGESHEEPLGLQEAADPDASPPLTVDEMLGGLRWRGAPKRRSREGRRRSARRLGPIGVKLAAIALVVVIGVVLWRMEVGRRLWGKVAGLAPWAGGELTVRPYRTTRSLPAVGIKILGTTEQGTITPESPDTLFLVVPIDLPRRYLVPSEEQYEKFLKEEERLDKETAQKSPRSTSPRAKTPARECTMVFDPSRFTLILPNGRRRAGEFIHVAAGDDDVLVGGFVAGCIRYSREPIDVDGEEATEVAWALDRADCKPPFKIQLDSSEPLPVPSK